MSRKWKNWYQNEVDEEKKGAEIRCFFLPRLTYLFAYLHRAVNVGHWLVEDHVQCYADETLRVRCADVSVTRGGFQTSVLGVDDLDELLIAADSQNGVLTRRGA